MIKPTLAPFLLLVLSTPRDPQGIQAEQTINRINHQTAPPLSRRILAASTGWLLPRITVPNMVTNKGKPRRLLANPRHPRPLPRHPRPRRTSILYSATGLPHPAHPPRLADRSRHQPLHEASHRTLPRRRKPPTAPAPSPATENQRERRTLLWAVLLGALSYLAQFKGYPYHRYPFLLFLLLLIAIDLTAALTATTATHDRNDSPPNEPNPNRPARALSAAILLWAALILGPSSALRASHYNWRNEEFRLTLQADLQRAAHRLNIPSLSGKIQCLDTIAGCLNTLYDMQLTQTTGFLYDEFLFHPPGSPAIDTTRAAFFKAQQTNPPLVLVIADPLFPSGPNHYAKLDQWPEFTLWLNQHYQLDAERHLTQPKRWVGQPIVPPATASTSCEPQPHKATNQRTPSPPTADPSSPSDTPPAARTSSHPAQPN